jgi:hypothetical protein
MNFLHSEAWLNCGDQAVINLDSQANVMLMDDSNFSSYRSGSFF